MMMRRMVCLVGSSLFATAALISAAPGRASAGKTILELGAPEVVSPLGEEGFLMMRIPEGWNVAVEGQLREAVLELGAAWSEGAATIVAVPVRSQDAVNVATESLIPDPTISNITGRATAVVLAGGGSRASIGMRRLFAALRDGQTVADAILLGLARDEGSVERWPAAAVASVVGNPDGWDCLVKLYWTGTTGAP